MQYWLFSKIDDVIRKTGIIDVQSTNSTILSIKELAVYAILISFKDF